MNKEYIRISTETAQGRWQSIRLSNLAETMSVAELQSTQEPLLKALREQLEFKVKRYEELRAPSIIIEMAQKNLDKVDKHPNLAILRRQLKKRSVT